MESFNKFYIKYNDRFLNFAKSYVNNSSAAEDIVAEAMAACWQSKENFPTDASALAFIAVVVKNKALNYIRHVQSRQQAVGRIDDEQWKMSVNAESLERFAPEDVLSDEIKQIVNDTISQLPEKTRKTYILFRVYNIPQKEIAVKMNLSLKSIEYHMAQASKALRTALKDYLDHK